MPERMNFEGVLQRVVRAKDDGSLERSYQIRCEPAGATHTLRDGKIPLGSLDYCIGYPVKLQLRTDYAPDGNGYSVSVVSLELKKNWWGKPETVYKKSYNTPSST